LYPTVDSGLTITVTMTENGQFKSVESSTRGTELKLGHSEI